MHTMHNDSVWAQLQELSETRAEALRRLADWQYDLDHGDCENPRETFSFGILARILKEKG